jgi:hypothetical protein
MGCCRLRKLLLTQSLLGLTNSVCIAGYVAYNSGAFELCDFAVPSSPALERDLPASSLEFQRHIQIKEQVKSWKQEQ